MYSWKDSYLRIMTFSSTLCYLEFFLGGGHLSKIYTKYSVNTVKIKFIEDSNNNTYNISTYKM